jgi:hypothetical protein
VFSLAAAAAAGGSSPLTAAAASSSPAAAPLYKEKASGFLILAGSNNKQQQQQQQQLVGEETAPLFYQPGKRGFYTPRQGRPTEVRLNAFRNVGRLIGLCLLQNELCPLFLNRHVIKVVMLVLIKDGVLYKL